MIYKVGGSYFEKTTFGEHIQNKYEKMANP